MKGFSMLGNQPLQPTVVRSSVHALNLRVARSALASKNRRSPQPENVNHQLQQAEMDAFAELAKIPNFAQKVKRFSSPVAFAEYLRAGLRHTKLHCAVIFVPSEDFRRPELAKIDLHGYAKGTLAQWRHWVANGLRRNWREHIDRRTRRVRLPDALARPKSVTMQMETVDDDVKPEHIDWQPPATWLSVPDKRVN